MKYLPRFYLFFLIICLPKMAISQKPLLDQYIDEAIQQNLVLKQKNIPLAKSRLALKEAEKRFKPSADRAPSERTRALARGVDPS